MPSFLLGEEEPEPEPVEIIVEDTVITQEMVEEALEPASDLVTLTYRYTDAASVRDVKKVADFELPLTLSRAVFTYSGTVLVGFDLSKVDIAINEETKTITITLPPFDIIASVIDEDSFEFVLEEQSIFNPVEMSTYTGVLSELKREANARVRKDAEFTAQAKENAEAILRSFLHAAGIDEDYTIEFN